MNPDALSLSSVQRSRLEAALERHEPLYDPAERMLHVPMPANASYHTTLRNRRVHPNYNSLVYAVALLDAGGRERLDRAIGILDRVTALQDSDPASKTYGIWSWYMDEPLERMAPPDWNFADFCGAQLLEALSVHEARLPRGLVERMDRAIVHAARSIQRRNVGLDYTNIVIMGSFVALAAAERNGLSDLKAYAAARFRAFHEYTRRQGSFNEYNSPTYTFIALNELGRIRRHVRDAEMRRLADALYRKGWEEIASHFHAPTQQWGGPHSRCYDTFLSANIAGFLYRATGGRFRSARVADEPELDEQRLVHACPDDLVASFLELPRARTVRQVFCRGETEVAGTTHLDPRFTLGSVNVGDLWNQRRALLAYWGTPEAPKYLHPRFLHDGWDFSAAQFFSVQREGDVLAGVSIAHDMGDTHLCLDMIRDGTIRARDLRLRFEFGGLSSSAPLAIPRAAETPEEMDLDGIRLALAVPHAQWDGRDASWEEGGEGGRRWLDLVFHHGPERAFRLPDLEACSAVLALRLGTGPLSPSRVEVAEEGSCLEARWEGLALRLPRHSRTQAELRAMAALGDREPLETAR